MSNQGVCKFPGSLSGPFLQLSHEIGWVPKCWLEASILPMPRRSLEVHCTLPSGTLPKLLKEGLLLPDHQRPGPSTLILLPSQASLVTILESSLLVKTAGLGILLVPFPKLSLRSGKSRRQGRGPDLQTLKHLTEKSSWQEKGKEGSSQSKLPIWWPIYI